MKLSLTEQIYKQLKDMIVKGELKENTFVTESELSKRFNMSKTPVREALGLLKAEGLIEALPHKGYIVSSLSAKDLHEIFQVRAILEVGAVELAIKSATQEEIREIEKFATLRPNPNDPDFLRLVTDINCLFHSQIVKATHNEYLTKMYNQIISQLSRVLYKDLIDTNDLDEVYEEHFGIYQAIAIRDVIKARDLVGQHVGKSKSRIFQ